MAEYYFYSLGSDNHISHRHACIAAGDAEAIVKARVMCGIYGIEIWEQKRLVARLDKNGNVAALGRAQSPVDDRALRAQPQSH